MSPTPAFLAARAAERRHRILTHLGVAEPITLVRRGYPATPGTVAVVPLTERHRLEFIAEGNAFFCGRAPLLGDVFLFLWRLSPEYHRVRRSRAHVLAGLGQKHFRFLRLWYAFGSWSAARAHRRLSALVRASDLFAAQRAIRTWLLAVEQDCQADTGTAPKPGAGVSTIAPEFCYADSLVDYVATHYPLTPAQILDLPRALVHQLHRQRLLDSPDGDIKVINPSDELLTA